MAVDGGSQDQTGVGHMEGPADHTLWGAGHSRQEGGRSHQKGGRMYSVADDRGPHSSLVVGRVVKGRMARNRRAHNAQEVRAVPEVAGDQENRMHRNSQVGQQGQAEAAVPRTDVVEVAADRTPDMVPVDRDVLPEEEAAAHHRGQVGASWEQSQADRNKKGVEVADQGLDGPVEVHIA